MRTRTKILLLAMYVLVIAILAVFLFNSSTVSNSVPLPSGLEAVTTLPANTLNVSYINQGDEPYCGSACLSMVLDFYGYNVSFQAVTNSVFNTTGNNMTMMQTVVDYGVNYPNLVFHPFTGSIPIVQNYISSGTPVIVCQNFTAQIALWHFRVVTGYNGQGFIVIDPYCGRCLITYSDFTTIWQESDSCINSSLAIYPR
jgi:ABC-type bacteriocin/lantibiotic exporter with double-glycine peptidase domain